MFTLASLLDKDPIGFWILVSLICYPAIMIILFEIISKIKKFLKKWLTNSQECDNL